MLVRGSLSSRRCAPQRSCCKHEVVCGALKRSKGRTGSRRRKDEGNSAIDPELQWWKRRPDDDWDTGSFRTAAPSTAEAVDRPQQQARGDSRGSGSGGSSSRGGGGGGRSAAGGRSGRKPHPWEKEEEDDGDGPGWWEVPRAEREAQLDAEPLEGWQEERLIVAFARGRRRVAVQELAADLGLHRSDVTDWFKQHAALPKERRDALQAPLAAAIESGRLKLELQQQQKQQERQQQQQQQRTAPALGPLLSKAKGPDTGFVPFKERGRGGEGPRRLAADALRTLESLYSRSPYPSKELLQNVCDMHRLQRDVALQWFVQRRDAEGRPHDPKVAKRLQEQAARAAESQAGGAEAAGGRRVVRGPLPGEEDELMRLMRGAAAEQQEREQLRRQQQQGDEEAEAAAAALRAQKVVAVTAREMAAIRSALPSPKKFKGAKLAEQLEIKQSATGSSLQIGAVRYVVKYGAVEWRRAWRRRRASKSAGGVPARRLDFVGWYRSAGSSSSGGGSGTVPQP